MNAIGIDFSRTATVVRLREETRGQRRWQNIDDGTRPIIPNAFDAEGRWAGAAVDAGSASLQAGFLHPLDGPWLGEATAEPFLDGLTARIVSFLGRVRPTRQNGFDVVFAPHGVDYASSAGLIERLIATQFNGALANAVSIPPARALLCRWASERPLGGVGTVRVIVVHVGDTQSAVVPYDVEFGEAMPRFIGSHAGVALADAGSFAWECALIRDLADRAKLELTAAKFLDLSDALRQIAANLRKAAPGTRIGPPTWLANRMYLAKEYARDEMARALPEISGLVVALVAQVEKALNAAPDRKTAEIMVGGTGAYWPFVRDALDRIFASLGSRLWQSADPREDVAYGAALWPLFRSTNSPTWQDGACGIVNLAPSADAIARGAGRPLADASRVTS